MRCSISLLRRLVEKERGLRMTDVGALGISKEGQAHWILGAVDDRVAVLAPGGCVVGTREQAERYRKDWKCQAPPGLDDLKEWVRLVMRLNDWGLKTEAGRLAERISGPEHWPHQIHARHVLISADLGRRPQHDWIWPLLASNRFLDEFKVPSWRYVQAFDGTGLSLDAEPGEMGRSLLPHVADLLVHGTTTPIAAVTEHGRRIKIVGQSSLDQACKKIEMLVVYIISPERSLRAPDTFWTTELMAPVAGQPGHFESSFLPVVPAQHGITYMVIARELVERSPLSYWRSASSAPREHFALPEHRVEFPSWTE